MIDAARIRIADLMRRADDARRAGDPATARRCAAEAQPLIHAVRDQQEADLRAASARRISAIAAILLLSPAVSALDIADDKRLHLAGGAIIGAATEAALAAATDLKPWQRWAIATATATAVGWGKELRDRRGHGTYEPQDAWATAAGGALGAGLSVTLTWRF